VTDAETRRRLAEHFRQWADFTDVSEGSIHLCCGCGVGVVQSGPCPDCLTATAAALEEVSRQADYRDCLELAAAIQASVECYDSDDLMEVIVPHLQPLIGRLEELEAAATESKGG